MRIGRGSMTRLIDVVLIILIGFLAIADLNKRTSIPLPAALDAALDTLQLAQRRLLLTAEAGPAFRLELVGASGLRRPLGRVSGADTLRAALGRMKEEHQLAGVDVEVRPDAPLQAAVDAVDACELFELERDLRFLDDDEASR